MKRNNLQKSNTGKMRKLAVIAVTGALVAGTAMPALAAKTPMLTRKSEYEWNYKKSYKTKKDYRFSYRSNGQIKTITDKKKNIKTTYLYDKNDRIKEEVEKKKNKTTTRHYEWNDDGTQVTVSDIKGNPLLEYEFYKDGNVKKLTQKDSKGRTSGIVSYTYNKKGDVLTRTDTEINTRNRSSYTEKEVNKYNAKGQPISITTYNKKGKATDKRVYTYKKGKLRKWVNTGAGHKRTLTFKYKGKKIIATVKSKKPKFVETTIYDTRYQAIQPEILPYQIISQELKEDGTVTTLTHKIKAYKKGALKGLIKNDNWAVTFYVRGEKMEGAKQKDRYAYKAYNISKKNLRIQQALVDLNYIMLK